MRNKDQSSVWCSRPRLSRCFGCCFPEGAGVPRADFVIGAFEGPRFFSCLLFESLWPLILLSHMSSVCALDSVWHWKDIWLAIPDAHSNYNLSWGASLSSCFFPFSWSDLSASPWDLTVSGLVSVFFLLPQCQSSEGFFYCYMFLSTSMNSSAWNIKDAHLVIISSHDLGHPPRDQKRGWWG